VLVEVHIRGRGVIDDAQLPLGPGLIAVTGETGAGKTMVVTGLALLFGARADSARVRSGAEQARIDGRIELPAASEVAERVRAAGGELDELDGGAALTLRRVVGANGRSRAYVGGSPAPLAVLGELGERLFALHGQSDQIRLTRAGEQRAALDRFAGLELTTYAAAFQRWRAAEAALRERTTRAAELRREADLLRHGIAEIEVAAPRAGEDEELLEQAGRLAHADALRAAARTAHDVLLGDAEDPAGDAADVSALLGTALRALDQQATADPGLAGLAERVRDLAAQAADLGGEFRDYADRLDADPARLAEIEARRAVLGGLLRKYVDEPAGEAGLAAVLAWAERARARLTDIDVSDEALAALSTERDAAAAEVARLATELSAARTHAAQRLAAAVSTELSGLAMPAATVTIDVRRRPAGADSPRLVVRGSEVAVGPEGIDEVEFLLCPHPEAPALPVARSASGGELSRIMLALEVCLAGTEPVPTMIFDEVDAGVGGRAALDLGARLARLAHQHQVIVVTHLAQVAAYADRHVVVDKPSGAGQVVASDVRTVSGGADRRAGPHARRHRLRHRARARRRVAGRSQRRPGQWGAPTGPAGSPEDGEIGALKRVA
jgi:DNA repair protein RecN (Recombination protein N)